MSTSSKLSPTRIIQVNLNRCRAAHDLLMATAKEMEVDILAVTEPNNKELDNHGWLYDIDKDAAIKVTNSKIPCCGNGAGKSYTWIEMADHILFSCYIAPSKSIDAFQDVLENIAARMNMYKKDTIITGDFNASAMEWGMPRNNQRGVIMCDWIATHNLTLTNKGTEATFLRGNASSIIDLTLTRGKIGMRTTGWKVLDMETLSDHRYIFFEVSENTKDAKKRKQIEGWDLRRLNETKLTQAVEKITGPITTPNQILDTITRVCNASMPLRKYTQHRRPVYWWTQDIAELRKKCLALRRKITRNNRRQSADITMDVVDYAEKRKELRLVINESKRNCWKKICDEIDYNLWGEGYKIAMRKLKLRWHGQTLTMENAIQVAKVLFPSRDVTAWREIDVSEAQIPEVTIDELIRASEKLKKKKAPGIDGIPVEVLQTAIQKKTDIFLPAFNNIMRSGKFPEKWKIAKLALIEKPKKNPNEEKKYRPLCLLNTSSKLLEHLIRNRLNEDLNLKQTLSDRQFGFRPERSTTDAVKKVTEILRSGIGGKSHRHRKIGALITLDIKNAFNTAPWKEIVSELEHRGAAPYLRKIVVSYFTNRKIVIETEDQIREFDMTCGVPQGSVLGPTLWNVLYDGLLRLEQPEGVTLVGYADDVAMVILGRNMEEIQLKTDIAMMDIKEWLQTNKLELAVEKTEIILATLKRRPLQDTLKILGEEIKPKEAIKYLGVWIDRKLCFTTHIEKTVTRASQTTAALAKIMPNIGGPRASKRKILSSVANSVMLYAAPAWSEAMLIKKNRKAYQRVQRQSALRISSAYRTAPTEAILVVAEQPPVDLLVGEIDEIYNADKEQKKQVRKEARLRTLQTWQHRWDENENEECKWTKKLIPDIENWINRKHGDVNFFLTQALTGHGSFRAFTRYIGKTDDDECIYCGESDTALHTIFHCPNWEEERESGYARIGRRLTPENMTMVMLEENNKWNEVDRMIGSILRRKSEEEREYEHL